MGYGTQSSTGRVRPQEGQRFSVRSRRIGNPQLGRGQTPPSRGARRIPLMSLISTASLTVGPYSLRNGTRPGGKGSALGEG